MYRGTKNIQKTVFVGMLSAVLVVLAQIHIPLPSGMPITLQTYAVALIGFLLGSKYGTATVGIYILLGTVGLPVFSGFSGGPGILFGMSGGFIWGFLFLSAGCGLAVKKIKTDKKVPIIRKKIRLILMPLAGLTVCHILGIMQFSIVMQMDFLESVIFASLPYVLKDAVSLILAFVTMKVIYRRIDFVSFGA